MTREPLARGSVPGRSQAISCVASRSRSSIRWLPTKPAAPVISVVMATSLPLAVLRFDVGLVTRVALLDRPPPPFVGLIPGHGLLQALLEVDLWRPAHRAQLGAAEAVAAIVALAILDRLDQLGPLAGELQHLVREVDVLHLVAAADVVDL